MADQSSQPAPTGRVNPQLVLADYYQREDEISLYDIMQAVLRYRFHIVGITLACTLIAALYAIMAPPLYQAASYLSAPDLIDIQVLQGSGQFTPKSVFRRFTENFHSRALRWQYFEENKLLDALVDETIPAANPYQVFERRFNRFLSHEWIINNDNKKSDVFQSGNVFKTTLQGKDAVLLAEWLNGFIGLVQNVTITSIKQDITAKLAHEQKGITDEIERLRIYAEKIRLDEVQRLEEADNLKRREIENSIRALKDRVRQQHKDRQRQLDESHRIAENLGISDLALMATNIGKSIQTPDVVVNLQDMPVYARGTKALMAEIEALGDRAEDEAFVNGLRELQQQLQLLEENPTILALQNRQSDDPYIGNLRELQKKWDELATRAGRLAADTDIKAVTIEQYATPPMQRIKPRRKLIVGVGLIAGLMASALIVIMLSLMSQGRVASSAKEIGSHS